MSGTPNPEPRHVAPTGDSERPTDERVIRTGADLWVHLIAKGGLAPDSWDRDIPDEIALRLGFSLTGSTLEAKLRASDTSPDALLDALFSAVKPYASMLVGLLRLFERWAIRRSDEHALIEFDFDGIHAVAFDYDGFRETVHHVVEACRPGELWLGDDQAWWGIIHALRELADKRSRSLGRADATGMDEWADGKRWLDSFERDVWPSPIDLPGVIEGDIPEPLGWIWDVWRQHLASVVRDGETPQQFRAGSREATNDDQAALELRLERDHWAANVVRTTAPVVHGLRTGEIVSGDIEAGLATVRAQFRRETRPASRRLDELEHVLSLPLWKQRSGLFSAWVFAAMESGLDGLLEVVPTEPGRLSFSFRRHLMGRISASPSVEVWAELRTLLLVPSMASRTEGVQPDYSLILDGADGEEAARSVAEVECKQYQRQGRKEFVGALHDYAASRPAARVILVSHGPAKPTLVHDRRLARYRDRCAVIGDLKPESESRSQFRRALIDALSVRSRLLPRPGQQFELQTADSLAPLSARTLSGSPNAGLCMHLVKVPGQSSREEYTVRSRGPDAAIACRPVNVEGRHGEEVEIRDWSPGTYTLSLHRLPPADAWRMDVTVELDWAYLALQFAPPLPGSASWDGEMWQVAEIVVLDGASGRSALLVTGSVVS